jgi:hypothetical protein
MEVKLKTLKKPIESAEDIFLLYFVLWIIITILIYNSKGEIFQNRYPDTTSLHNALFSYIGAL